MQNRKSVSNVQISTLTFIFHDLLISKWRQTEISHEFRSLSLSPFQFQIEFYCFDALMKIAHGALKE